MKRIMLVVAVMFSLVGLAKKNAEYWQVVRRGADADLTLTVKDELRNPVSGATVRVAFSLPDGEESVAGQTDIHGRYVLGHATDGNSIGISVAKDGYYGSHARLSLIKMGHEHDIRNGRWIPCPIKREIVLRKQRNPISPFSHGGVYRIPATNEWCDFDLSLKDWVHPHGGGRTPDVAFKFGWQGEKPLEWTRQSFAVRFLGNVRNGGCLTATVTESGFPYLYQCVPQWTYAREFNDVSTPQERKAGMLDGTKDFVFRIQSVTNSVGEISSCHYGRFRLLDYGLERDGFGSVMLRYDYNLNSNDTNLEFKKQ